MEVFNIETAGLADDPPTLTFEEGSYSISELLDSHLLPVVVQYDKARQTPPTTDFNFDLSQPLLLYKKRNIQKVSARSLCLDEGQYKEVGESLLIPEDYKGWFAVLQRVTGSPCADDNVPHFTSIEELANSNTEKFLIGGTQRITGLQVNGQSESRLNQEPRIFLPGDVLAREKLYYGETQKKTRLFRKPKYITEKFLMCRDESDKEVLLPFEQTGIFYQVSNRGGKPSKNVLQMSDVVARKLTPRIIKLVYGRFPITPSSFTGLMKANSSKIETTVIASTIIHNNNVLMELPVTSDMYFRVALTNDELRTNPCFLNAKSLCAEKASAYMRNIKICYSFIGEENLDQFFLSNRSSSATLNSANSQTFIADLPSISDSDNDDKLVTRGNKQSNDITVSDDVLTRHGKITPFRMSEDITTAVLMRQAKTLSTSRMSFCLGNSYLTIPVCDRTSSGKRDSGNNNTNPVSTFLTKKASIISEKDSCITEAEITTDSSYEPSPSGAVSALILDSTNAAAHVNLVPPLEFPVNPQFPNYRPVAASSGPNTSPPEAAPPPLPNSCSTSGASSGSSSVSGEDNVSKRASSSSFEYAVPKIEDASVILSTLPDSMAAEIDRSKLRRPSTFTFSEGCTLPTFSSALPGFPSIEDEEESYETGENCTPVYENIRSLMEIVAKLEEKDVTHEADCGISCDNSNTNNLNGKCFMSTCSDSCEGQIPRYMLSSESETDEMLEELKIVECDDEIKSCTVNNCTTLYDGEEQGNIVLSNNGEEPFPALPVETNTDDRVIDSSTQTVQEETMWKIVVNKNKKDSSPPRRMLQETEKAFSDLGADELLTTLRAIGIKEDSISVVGEKHIDGPTLAAVLHCDNVELAIRECLKGVHLVDQQKISMFIRGWRPDNDA